MPYSYISGRNIPVLFYSYAVDGTEYVDDMGRDPETLSRFYGFISEGKIPVTSQINEFRYEEFFEQLLQKGDVLHIAFGSGMTPSFTHAADAAETLREKYPERRITVIDSLCSSSGYGLLVDIAADMRDEGAKMEDIEKWVLENRHGVHHQFFCTDLKYFRRSGRVSGAAAAVASVLGLCPIMRLDDKGKIIAYDKVRGMKNAMAATVGEMQAHARGGADYNGKCFICHSNCLSSAQALKDAIQERFPNISGGVRIFDIGTIIASHCGPGTVAVFFLGDDRAPDKSLRKA